MQVSHALDQHKAGVVDAVEQHHHDHVGDQPQEAQLGRPQMVEGGDQRPEEEDQKPDDCQHLPARAEKVFQIAQEGAEVPLPVRLGTAPDQEQPERDGHPHQGEVKGHEDYLNDPGVRSHALEGRLGGQEVHHLVGGPVHGRQAEGEHRALGQCLKDDASHAVSGEAGQTAAEEQPQRDDQPDACHPHEHGGRIAHHERGRENADAREASIQPRRDPDAEEGGKAIEEGEEDKVGRRKRQDRLPVEKRGKHHSQTPQADDEDLPGGVEAELLSAASPVQGNRGERVR